MNAFDCDVLVIGGGPAGSSAAAFARKRGLSVRVLERETFPRFRIGESLLPHGNQLLRESGAWEKVERAGFIRKYGALFYLSNGAAEKEVIFSDGMIPGVDYTFQVERARFDALLLDHAASLGTAVTHGATVRGVSPIVGGLRAEVVSAAGISHVNARWILDAGGRERAFSCDIKGPLDPSPFPKRIAVYTHFHGVVRPSGLAAGHTTVVRLADGWFWIIPIDETRTSVGLVTTVAALRRGRAAPEDVFCQTVEASPKLRELMEGATPTMEFRVTSDYSYFHRELATERLLLIGDAGGFFDPIFSSGVYVAMASARRAVDCLSRAHAAGRPLSRAEQRAFTRATKSHAGVFQKLIACFYDNDSFAVFMRPRSPLKIGLAINSIVAGHARLDWPVRWRFKLFLLICRLQKFFPMVPRIDFSGMSEVVASSAEKKPASASH